MNVASFELCRELYGLSGWDDPEQWLHRKGNGDSKLFEPIAAHLMDCDAPAYDLGYLLRKLPKDIELGQDGGSSWYCRHNKTDEAFGVHGIEFADTPEDAACKLAIGLFKQGILKRI